MQVSSEINPPVQARCPVRFTSLKILQKVELICRIALAIFCAYVAPLPCLIFGTLGILMGAAYTITMIIRKEKSVDGNGKPQCATGFFEYLTGVKLSPVLSRLITAVFIGAHIRHDPVFYVPFCGTFIGFFVGKQLIEAAHTIFHKKKKDVSIISERECCCAT